VLAARSQAATLELNCGVGHGSDSPAKRSGGLVPSGEREVPGEVVAALEDEARTNRIVPENAAHSESTKSGEI